MLDADSSTATLGKTAGKDAQDNKPTYVSAMGTARARELAQELRQQALEAVVGFGPRECACASWRIHRVAKAIY